MTKRRSEIVIAVASLPKWVRDFNVVSSWLAESGWDVTLIYPRPNGRADSGWDSERVIAAEEACLHPHIRPQRMPMSRNGGPLNLLGLIRLAALAAWRAARGAQLFILWSPFPILVFGPWIRLFGRPCLYMVTGLGMLFAERNRGTLRHRLVRRIYRFLFSSPRAVIIVHNHEDKAELAATMGAAPDRVVVTGGCGVDPDSLPYRATPFVADPPTILVPSRLLRDKGTLDAAAASSILSASGLAHRMVFTSNPVAGRADALTEQELRLAASAPGVEFAGYLDDMAALFARADIVCVPSWYREGLQTALLEAAAAGCPLVACDNVGVSDFLRPDIDAIVVPPRSPEALAEGLRRMLSDAAAAERMRQSAYRRMLSGFTKRHMLDLTVKALGALGIRPVPETPGAGGVAARSTSPA